MKQLKADPDRMRQLTEQLSRPAVHPDEAIERAMMAMDAAPKSRFCERFFKLTHDNEMTPERVLYLSVMAKAAGGDGRVQMVGDPVYATHGEGYSILHLQWVETDTTGMEVAEPVNLLPNPILRAP